MCVGGGGCIFTQTYCISLILFEIASMRQMKDVLLLKR